MTDQARGFASDALDQRLVDGSARRTLSQVLKTLKPIEETFDPIDDPLPKAIDLDDDYA